MVGKSPIGKRLKEARLEAGLSQKQLGIATGIDQFVASARMNQYETCKHSPDFSMVHKIANVLEVPTAYFYAVDDELASLIKIYGKTGKKSQHRLIAFAKRL